MSSLPAVARRNMKSHINPSLRLKCVPP